MKVVLAVELIGLGGVTARARDRLIKEKKTGSVKCIVSVLMFRVMVLFFERKEVLRNDGAGINFTPIYLSTLPQRIVLERGSLNTLCCSLIPPDSGTQLSDVLARAQPRHPIGDFWDAGIDETCWLGIDLLTRGISKVTRIRRHPT